MTFIDWSDSDEMLGLLVEYVADSAIEADGDRERERFLDDLSKQLVELAARAQGLSAAEMIAALRRIRDSVDPEFAGDPVMTHVDACIEELERIGDQMRQ